MRTLGSITSADVEANIVDFCWFFKIEIPTSSYVRYTTHPDGDYAFDGSGGDFDSVAATWVGYDFTIGSLVQNQSSPLDVSYVDIQNLDNVWSDYLLNDGIRFRSVQIWQAWFDTTDGSFIGSLKMYDGRTDEATLDGNRIKISLAPHRTPWTVQIPARRMIPTCQYLFKNADTCQYGGSDTSCNRTIIDCTSKSNQTHFGGFHLLPPQTLKISWGAVQTQLPPALTAPPQTPVSPVAPGPGAGPAPPPVGGTPPSGGPPVVGAR